MICERNGLRTDNLGRTTNGLHHFCPMVTLDGRPLFFSRRISEPKDGGWANVVAGDVYWISTAATEALRP